MSDVAACMKQGKRGLRRGEMGFCRASQRYCIKGEAIVQGEAKVVHGGCG